RGKLWVDTQKFQHGARARLVVELLEARDVKVLTAGCEAALGLVEERRMLAMEGGEFGGIERDRRLLRVAAPVVSQAGGERGGITRQTVLAAMDDLGDGAVLEDALEHRPVVVAEDLEARHRLAEIDGEDAFEKTLRIARAQLLELAFDLASGAPPAHLL